MSDYVGQELQLFAEARNWKRYVADRLRPFLQSPVLEVGAGLGETTRFGHRPGLEWHCLEPDATMAELLRHSVEQGALPAGCVARQGTTEQLLPSFAGSFGSVIYVDVLEHIEDDEAELARALQLLRSGGTLVVLSPAWQFLYSPFDKAIGHYRRYNRPALRKLAPPALRLLSIRYMDSLGFFLSLANRMMLSQSMPTRRQILFWDNTIVPISRAFDAMSLGNFGKSVLAAWSRP